MVLLMQSVFGGSIQMVKIKLLIVGVLWGLLSFAIAIDFFSGVRKAKRSNTLRTSIGYRQTVNKVMQYYSFMSFALLFDIIIMFVLSSFGVEDLRVLPFASIVCCSFLIFIEASSVFEKTEIKEKKKYKEGLKDLKYIIENKDDIKKVLDDLTKTENDENK